LVVAVSWAAAACTGDSSARDEFDKQKANPARQTADPVPVSDMIE
jgi:hypothetical protein